MTAWTTGELLATSASRLLEDSRTVFAGVGMPLVASVLAQHLHAPRLTVVLEGGIIGPRITPGELPISTNEMRAGRHSMMLTDITDIFLYAQRGFFDYGFLGGAQVDRYGNINTSVVGIDGQRDGQAGGRPQVRLPGSGGANDIASACREVFIVTRHERRRFVERVDFVTSPGHLSGGDSRRRAGLLSGGPTRVLTDLALMDFEPDSKRMRLIGLQPGASMDEVAEQTSFELLVAGEVASLPPPTDQELAMVRKIDPDGAFTS